MRRAPVLLVLGFASVLLAQSPTRSAVAPVSAKPLVVVTGPSPNEQWIARMYQDLLGRAPEPASLNTFLGELDHGTTRQQVARQIVSSTEYRYRVVGDLYQHYLHRPADPGSVSYWTGRLGSLGYLGVQKDILSSPEYFAARGGGSPEKFIDALYQDVLGRPADPSARANFLKPPGGGRFSQSAVVNAVVGSGEGRAALVRQLSQRLLHRPSDPAGAAFANQLAAGGSEETVLVELLSSNEYYQRRP